MKNLLLWGAGGHGKVVLDVARSMRQFDEIGFIDDDTSHHGSLCGVEVLGTSAELQRLRDSGYREFLISIGNNRVRARCFTFACNQGFTPATLVHHTAVRAGPSLLGEGSVVMARAVINADADIGQNCIINTGAIVEHDCRIGDHVHISPGVVLGGGVRVHPYAQLGLGAIALPGAEIGEGAVVGAGGVVLGSIPPGVTAIGVPARVIGHSRASEAF